MALKFPSWKGFDFFGGANRRKHKQASKQAHKRLYRRLQVESLEQRQLLSAIALAPLPTSPAPDNQPETLFAQASGFSSDGTVEVDFTNNGTSIGTSSYQSNITSSLHFAGASDSYVQIPNMGGLSSLTFATWVQRDTTGTKQYEIMSGERDGWGVYFSENNDNNEIWFTYRGYAGWSSSGVISDSNWHFVAVTYSAGQLTFYIDGQPAGTADGYGDFATSDDYYLGGAPTDSAGDPNEPLTGSLAETLVYDTALPASEIAALYNGGKGVANPAEDSSLNSGLYAQYLYNEGSGTEIVDTSGNPDSHDGTIVSSSGSITREGGFGFASLTLSAPTVGSNTYQADYILSSLPLGWSNTVTQTVLPGVNVSLSASSSTLVAGQPVDLTATVTPSDTPPPAALSGSVTFYDGTTELGTATVEDGAATLSGVILDSGSQTLSADYVDDPNYTGAPATLAVTVKQALPLSITAAANPLVAGQQTTLTASLPANASGSVDWSIDGEAAGTSSLTTSSSSLTVDGESGSYVAIGNEDREEFTFATWVKRDTTGTKQYLIMSGAYGGWGVYFSENSDNNLLWFTYRGYAGWCSTASIADSAWHFVAVTFDAGALTFYIDGVACGTGSVWGSFDSGGAPYYLGGAAPDGDNGCPLDGQMDETLIFDRPLSATEVAELYNGGNGRCDAAGLSGLVAGYHYDSAAPYADFSGQGNDGAPSGGVSVGDAGAVDEATTTLTSPSDLAIGSHAITATYVPDGSSVYISSTSDEFDEEIYPEITLTGLSAALPGATGLSYLATVAPDAADDTPTGTVTFTFNGETYGPITVADGAAEVDSLTAPTTPGDYTITTSYSGDTNYVAYTASRTLVVSAAPTIATGHAAAATVDSTTHTTAALSVLGADDSGDLIYDWSVLNEPTNASDPTFSDNDSNTAKDTTATFSQYGTYTLLATVANAAGLVATSEVTCDVGQYATSISVAVPSLTLAEGTAEQLTATELDQFGNPMETQPSFTWSRDIGSVDSSGNYTAPSDSLTLPNTETATVTAAADSLTGQATVTIVPAALDVIGRPTVAADMPYTLNLSGIDTDSPTGWTINWGDDTTSSLAYGAATATHLYATAGTYDITAQMNDSGASPEVAMNQGLAGFFDPAFAGNVATAGFTSGAFEAATDTPDGQIIAAGTDGSGDEVITSFNPDGSQGNIQFDESGMSGIHTLAIQPQAGGGYDILAAGVIDNADGSKTFALVRYNSDGSLDTTFAGGAAIVSPFASGVTFRPDRLAVKSDGSILVAGYVSGGSSPDLAVVHYMADGTLDTSFGSGGEATVAGTAFDDEDPCGLAVDASGNIVVAGTATIPGVTGGVEIAVARFTSGGTLDSSFGTDGVVRSNFGDNNDHATAVAVLGDGKILVAGYNDTGYLDLVRYQSDGTLDTTFADGGRSNADVAANYVGGIALQPDGAILVSGSLGASGDFGVARFTADGTLDTAFGTEGIASAAFDDAAGSPAVGTAAAVIFQPDGSILAVGFAGDPYDNAGNTANAPVLARLAVGGNAVAVSAASTDPLPVSGTSSIAAGDTYTLSFGDGWTDLGSGTDATYTISWGDGTDDTTIAAGDLAQAGDQVTHTFTGSSSGISIDVTVGDNTYTVGNLPLTVDTTDATTTDLALSNSSPSFGQSVTLTATVAADVSATGSPSGTVDFYDGTTYLGTATVSSLTGQASLPTPLLGLGDHTFTAVYSGDSTFLASTSALQEVDIDDSGVTDNIVLESGTSATEGTSYSLSLPTNAPEDDGGAEMSQWQINWGDGTTDTYSGDPSSEPHIYGAPGNFTITAIGVDSSNNAYTAALDTGVNGGQVSVSHVGPSGLSLTVDFSQYSGADTQDSGGYSDDELHGTFSGPGSLESYTVTIDWGDGTTDSPDTSTFTLDPGQTSFDYPLQQYARTGNYTITVTVSDADDQTDSSTPSTIDVNYTNSQLSALALSLDNSTISAGDAVTLSGSFNDAQTNVAHTVTINWGDGTEESPDLATILLAPGETTFQADPQTYVTAGNYTITATITGVDGAPAPATIAVGVDAVPADVMVVASVPDVSESQQSPGEFTLTRDGDASSALTVNLTLAGGTIGTDYTISAGSGCTISASGNEVAATFTVGSSTATVELTPIDTSTVGGTLQVTATIAAGSGYVADSVYPSAAVTIFNDDLPTASIVATIPTATESGTSGELTVNLNSAATSDMVVDYTITDSGNPCAVYSGNGDGYQMLSGDVIIADGQSSATIAITPIDLGIADSSQTVMLTLATDSESSYNIDASQESAMVTIVDDDLPTVSIFPVDAPVAMHGEAESTPQFDIVLSQALNSDLNVYYQTSTSADTGSGLGSEQYVTIDAGQITATVEGTYGSDTDTADTVCSQVDLATASDYSLSTTHYWATSILVGTSAPYPLVCANPQDARISKMDLGSATVTFTISSAQATDYTVPYTITGGTAGVDYDDSGNGSVTIPAGETTASITITALATGRGDPTQLLTIAPSLPFYKLAANENPTITLVDDVPRVTISDAEAVDGDNETSTVMISHAAPYQVDVPDSTSNSTAIAGTDYTATTGTVAFAANTTNLAQAVSVPTLDDVGNTLGETFKIVLGSLADFADAVGRQAQAEIAAASGSLTELNANGTPYTDDTSQTIYVGQRVTLGIKIGPKGTLGSYTIYYDSNYVVVRNVRTGAIVPSGTVVPNNATAYVEGVGATVVEPPDLFTTAVVLRYVGVGGSNDVATVNYTVTELEVYWDNTATTITNETEETEVGRMVTLSAVSADGSIVTGGQRGSGWTIAGDKVANFYVTQQVVGAGAQQQTNYAEHLEPSVTLNRTVTTFAWTEGGPHEVQLSVQFPFSNPIVASATFDVERPTANARVEMENYANSPNDLSVPNNMNFIPLGQGQNGMNTFAAHVNGNAVAGFEGSSTTDDSQRMTPGAEFLADPTDANHFDFTWVQVVTAVHVLVSNNGGSRWSPLPTRQAPDFVGRKLDNWYPYAATPFELEAFDNPRWVLPTVAPVAGEALQLRFNATMWLMCSPDVGDTGEAIAVPLGYTDWRCTFTVKAVQTATGLQWQTTGFHTPSAKFTDTIQYPIWTATTFNSPSANNFIFDTRFGH